MGDRIDADSKDSQVFDGKVIDPHQDEMNLMGLLNFDDGEVDELRDTKSYKWNGSLYPTLSREDIDQSIGGVKLWSRLDARDFLSLCVMLS